MESALLWYDIYSNTMKQHDFALYPYERCTANITINGNNVQYHGMLTTTKYHTLMNKLIQK